MIVHDKILFNSVHGLLGCDISSDVVG